MAKTRELRQDIQSKGEAELRRMLAEAREELRDLRFKVGVNQHKDVRQVREIRQLIARLMTKLHQPTKVGK